MGAIKKINFKKIQAIICDFDGVLTDNKVYADQDGREMVACSRADGLAFSVLKSMKIPLFILSTEKNPVVKRRAEKLKVPVIYGVDNKLAALKELIRKNKFTFKQVLYIGNDFNDLEAMSACGWRACPSDAYPQIKKIANIVIKTPGGHGVVRDLLGYIL